MRTALILTLFFLCFLTPLHLFSQQGFTEADRRLLLEIKVKVESNEKRIEDLRADMNERFRLIDKRFEAEDKRFEAVDKRFEDIDKRFEDIDKRFEDIDKRFESFDKRFDELFSFIQILAGIFVTLIAVVIGFAYWDRRTIIKKAKSETIEEIERDGRLRDLIHALREKARSDQELADLLRKYHLM